MNDLYDMLFRRCSVRDFDVSLHLSEEDLRNIDSEIDGLKPLIPEIRTAISIVMRKKPDRRGEYAIEFYSAEDSLWLLNAGYMLEQLDLSLESIGIGVCWHGTGKPDRKEENGLPFVIMLLVGKIGGGRLRRKPSDFSRQTADKIWPAPFDPKAKEAFRLAPSSLNSQPWRIEGSESRIDLYDSIPAAYLFPLRGLARLNAVDMGISMFFLETALRHLGYGFSRSIKNEKDGKRILIASYALKKKTGKGK